MMYQDSVDIQELLEEYPKAIKHIKNPSTDTVVAMIKSDALDVHELVEIIDDLVGKYVCFSETVFEALVERVNRHVMFNEDYLIFELLDLFADNHIRMDEDSQMALIAEWHHKSILDKIYLPYDSVWLEAFHQNPIEAVGDYVYALTEKIYVTLTNPEEILTAILDTAFLKLAPEYFDKLSEFHYIKDEHIEKALELNPEIYEQNKFFDSAHVKEQWQEKFCIEKLKA